MSGASRRASEQMQRDGIVKLRGWAKPKRIGCASYQIAIVLPHCGETGCGKRASYSTPVGDRCFTHAIAQATDRGEA